ncbi:hypothetical protein Tco_0478348 [Tanacetum coccineum]
MGLGGGAGDNTGEGGDSGSDGEEPSGAIREDLRETLPTGHRIRIRRTPDTASSPTSQYYNQARGSHRHQDEHEFLAEEQPLPPVDSPTAESPGHVTKSDPEEDPEEYEDDEIEDGPVDYPMDGGDDGDDDDGDSSRDDANDEDEDDEDEEEEEEEHIALADSAIVVPINEPVFPPEGT